MLKENIYCMQGFIIEIAESVVLQVMTGRIHQINMTKIIGFDTAAVGNATVCGPERWLLPVGGVARGRQRGGHEVRPDDLLADGDAIAQAAVGAFNR